MLQEANPNMKKIGGLIAKILMIVIGLSTVSINLAMGYIMFAPDAWPKPFYLQYSYPGYVPTSEPAHETSPQTAAEEHTSSGEEGSTTEVSVTVSEEGSGVDLQIKPGQGLRIDTGSKIVNLVDVTGRKYIRAGIVLEFAPNDLAFFSMAAEEKTTYDELFNEEINSKLPVINDVIITVLSSKTFEAIYTAEGKEALKLELIQSINAQLPEFQVVYVYFTEFVLQ